MCPVKSARTSRAVGRPPSPEMTVERPDLAFRYLSGSPYLPALRWRHGGLMFGPAHGNATLPLTEIVWAADNGCFTQGASFSVERWLGWLDRWPLPARATCLFAVLPDAPFDHLATVARSLPHAQTVRALGYVPALAIQEGARMANVPWDEIGAVFIAGGKPLSTPTPLWDDIPQARAKATRAFKTGATAWAICREARRRGLYVHIARCNSKRAIQAAWDMGAHSADGTMLAFAPDQNARRVEKWFEQLCAHPSSQRVAWGVDPLFSRCGLCGRDVWVASTGSAKRPGSHSRIPFREMS